MEKQGGIYARYSPGRDLDRTSMIEAQVAMCRERAQLTKQKLAVPSKPRHWYEAKRETISKSAK